MKQAKIVIGANFGDEGKGLMTDYFAHEAYMKKESCLVVCHNGGSQKGHTVTLPSGMRHVFHHFGSGTFQQAATYLAKTYIINPIMFNKEWEELMQKNCPIKCWVNRGCRLTTPFEMMINQIMESHRQSAKHGSCGLGIFETIKRDEVLPLDAWTFARWSDAEKEAFLLSIANAYLPKRLSLLGLSTLDKEWQDLLEAKEMIIHHYIEDFKQMASRVNWCDDGLLDEYDNVIFEGAQGLLLDEDNTSYMPHLTPSHTGLYNPLQLIESRDCEIEVCYVTRTYLTRHGAGRFDTECQKEELNPLIQDLTNVPNPFQDCLRYGKMNAADLESRIVADYSGKVGKHQVSLAVTQINMYKESLASIKKQFSDYKLYLSDGFTYQEICIS